MEKFIIYFTAEWCQPCKVTRPIVEALNQESENHKFFIVDSDAAPEMTADFKISGVPAFVFIKNGEEVRREIGSRTKEQLEEFIIYLEK